MADVLNFASKLNRDYCNTFIAANSGTGNETSRTMHGSRTAKEQHGKSQAVVTHRHRSAIPVGVAYAMEAALLMARASTIAVLADCLIATVCRFVFVSPIVIGVATRAVRLECRILPDDYRRVVLVTVGAGQVTVMIQWFERRCCVAEVIWRK